MDENLKSNTLRNGAATLAFKFAYFFTLLIRALLTALCFLTAMRARRLLLRASNCTLRCRLACQALRRRLQSNGRCWARRDHSLQMLTTRIEKRAVKVKLTEAFHIASVVANLIASRFIVAAGQKAAIADPDATCIRTATSKSVVAQAALKIFLARLEDEMQRINANFVFA